MVPLLVVALGCTLDEPHTGEGSHSRRLRAEGTHIVDGSGDVVPLRGVAVGGWNFHENWITLVDYPAHGRLHVLGEEAGIGADVGAVLTSVGPNEKADAAWLEAFAAALEPRVGAEATAALLAELALYPSVVDDSDKGMRLVLEDRFGVEGRDALLDRFQAAWFDGDDIAWLAEQGFTLVRLPMGYRGLTSMSDVGDPTELVWNEAAFAQLDAILDACETHGMYAVLDVQESPGGQNEYSGASTLYTDPAMQALTVELWQELSRRYADRDAVAAYSLLAEPMSAPSTQARDEMYDQLVKAIRAQGDDHLLVIHDGFSGLYTLPEPAEYGWEGVVYSTHLFEWGADSLADYEAVIGAYATLFDEAQARQGVPYYIGSFATFQDEDWAYDGAAHMVDTFEAHQWPWTLWTYKRIDDPIDAALWGTSTSWGLRGRLEGEFSRPDVYRDDEATLGAKFDAYGDLDIRPNEALYEAVTAGW